MSRSEDAALERAAEERLAERHDVGSSSDVLATASHRPAPAGTAREDKGGARTHGESAVEERAVDERAEEERSQEEPTQEERAVADGGAGSAPLVSVLIPTLDEERELPRLLDHLAALRGRWELVVADGGSRDATLRIAREHRARPRVVERRGGRAAQLNAAARAACGDALLFLHADSRLPADAYDSLAAALRTPTVAGGNFALRFDGGGAFERALGVVYRLQRRLGTYYGDSAIWVRRATFDALGGFREIAIMDDFDFARRLERHGATRCLPGPATTSPRRWRELGVARTVLVWLAIRWLYVAGVPPTRLARLYRVVR